MDEKEKHYWTTKDNKVSDISQMETSHIQNCIKLLEKNAEEGQEVVISYGYEDDNDFITGETRILEGKDYLERTEYRWLKKELNSRTNFN